MKFQALPRILGIFACALGASSLQRCLATTAGQEQGGGARNPRGAPASLAGAGAAAATDAQAWFAKGQAALQAGDLDSAEADFRRVAAIDPNSGAAYAN